MSSTAKSSGARTGSIFCNGACRRGPDAAFRCYASEASPPAPPAVVPMPEAAAPLVLYVEDDRLNIVLMEEVFRRLSGWRLEVAETGGQALQALETLRPDLVLVDMNLPDMSGLELLGQLRADTRLACLRCVALSADDLPDQVRAARDAGFTDYWTKPIDVPRLTEALRAALD